MLPVIALVGRPNVGKSTLFNRLTRSRDALPYIVVDTGGFEPVKSEGIVRAMASQAELAIEEADVVIFVVDARTGLSPQDERIAQHLRRAHRPVVLAVNKAEGLDITHAVEFYELAMGEPQMISASHGHGVHNMIEMALSLCPQEETDDEEESETSEDRLPRVKVAVAGRPNAGKSTLINALLGEDRLIAYDMPGTTRDSIRVDFEYDGRDYALIDTAGLRRKGKVFEAIEKFSVVKTLQAIADANVVILVLDAKEGIAEHDAHIAGYVLESGRALVVAINKWDALDSYERSRIDEELDHKLHFLNWARQIHISALKRNGLNHLMKAVSDAHAAAFAKLSTPKLTRALIEAVERQSPPRVKGVRPKLRYAHQGGQNPPVVVIHGNSLQVVPDSYKRYLESWFREKFNLAGTPLRIEFKINRNPYVEKKD